MMQNRIQPDVFTSLLFDFQEPGDAAGASRLTRVRAHLLADRLDRQVDSGVPVSAGSALAVHIARLTSTRERDKLAHTLRRTVNEARRPGPPLQPRIPVRASAIQSTLDLIGEVTLLLQGPGPVRARGMARLRLLLSDGTGPFYRRGRGSLSAALRGVLAAL